MPERLLRTHEVAEKLGTTVGVAVSIMHKQGVRPIDFGMGRGRGARWLESAVEAAILEMHQQSQGAKTARQKVRRPQKTGLGCRLVSMSIDDIHKLTNGPCVQ